MNINNDVIKRLRKGLRLKLILVIAVVLSFNTFAWFIYSSKVSNDITAHVKAWRIQFESGENGIVEYINFDIDNIYPGMDDYNNYINIVNHGETKAILNYEVDSVKVLGEEYKIDEYTSDEMINILKSNYPFLVEFILTNGELNANNGSADFQVRVSWAFEAGNDELDTYYGNKSYEYKKNNPGKSGISIVIKLSANQDN